MDSNLHTDTPPLRTVHVLIHAHIPPLVPQGRPRLYDHVAHKLALVHESGTQRLGAGPGLWAAAIEVDAIDEGGGEGRRAGELQGAVGAELEDGGRLGSHGGDGEVFQVLAYNQHRAAR